MAHFSSHGRIMPFSLLRLTCKNDANDALRQFLIENNSQLRVQPAGGADGRRLSAICTGDVPRCAAGPEAIRQRALMRGPSMNAEMSA
jgi:hypothetical protein